jgi:hypothetical protein
MYDHVALVVKFSDGRVVLFEALRETGVGICDWDKFINKNGMKCILKLFTENYSPKELKNLHSKLRTL